MEKNRQYYILLAGAVFIFMASYAVGFVIGKKAGIQEAEKRFTIEKQNLLKTIASLSPVSRPKVEEKVVIVNASNETESTVAENQTQEQAEKQPAEAKTKEAEEKKETEKTATSNIQTASQQEEKTKTKSITTGNYYVQVGVFRDKTNVAKLMNRLKSKGFNAKSIILPGGKVKVIVGYFSRNEAKVVYRKLKNIGISGIVKRRRS